MYTAVASTIQKIVCKNVSLHVCTYEYDILHAYINVESPEILLKVEKCFT